MSAYACASRLKPTCDGDPVKRSVSRASPLTVFTCQTARLRQRLRRAIQCSAARILCGAGYAVSLFSPLQIRGGWRARWRCHDLEHPHSLSRVRSASRRATQTSLRSLGVFADVLLTAPGRAFRGPLVKAAQPLLGLPPFLAASPAAPADSRNGLRQPAPGRRTVVATGRGPGAARVLGGAFISRPRAPHPAPSSDAS